MKIDNIDLINDMYTKISDIKFKSDIDTNIKNNQELNMKNNQELNIKNNQELNIINEIQYNSNYDKNYSDNESPKFKNSNLDFLTYDESSIKNKNIKNIKKNKLNKKSKNNYYLFIFILFWVLNSYWIINFLNYRKISYNMSLIIRGIIFILIIHFQKFVLNF
jgi:hypothetical protein